MQPDPRIPDGLPAPDATRLVHSARVAEYIRERIVTAGGMMGLAEFMHDALYAPGLGYYTAGSAKFGVDGDFVTAPEISPLFGRVVARQCAATLTALNGSILELGAGSGALAVAMLQKLAELDALPESYQILEVSPDLIERQRQKVMAEIPQFASLVEWIDALPENFKGVVIANEVLDALPVERFVRTADDVLQVCVACTEDPDGSFIYQTRSAGDVLRRRVLELEESLGGHLAEGYVSEVSLALPSWIDALLRSLDEGLVLLFDYGVTRREYYAVDRDQGWLRCHFRHHAHNEPLIYPGIQDITAWVDFSAVAEAAAADDVDIVGFVTQALFLISGGLDNELADFAALNSIEQVELSRQIKLLTLPGEMGENFKCIGLRKGATPVPASFDFGDRTHRL